MIHKQTVPDAKTSLKRVVQRRVLLQRFLRFTYRQRSDGNESLEIGILTVCSGIRLSVNGPHWTHETVQPKNMEESNP